MSDGTINIAFKSDDWRGVALSNFCLTPFLLDGQLLASIEGFIQGIKLPPGHPARTQAFRAWAWEAKECGKAAQRRHAYWGDQRVDFGSVDHHQLVELALRTKFEQNQGLRHVLRSTQGLEIEHRTGDEPEPAITSLPAAIFCRVLTDIRNRLT